MSETTRTTGKKPNMAVEIAGIKLRNPVMPASGTFGYGEEYAPFLDLENIGAIVTKGLSLKPKAGNPTPRIAETISGMLNAIDTYRKHSDNPQLAERTLDLGDLSSFDYAPGAWLRRACAGREPAARHALAFPGLTSFGPLTLSAEGAE